MNQIWRWGRKKGRPHTPSFIWYLSILRRARLCPILPGLARLCAAIRARSNPTPHAPVLRMTLVGKGKLPQTNLDKLIN